MHRLLLGLLLLLARPAAAASFDAPEEALAARQAVYFDGAQGYSQAPSVQVPAHADKKVAPSTSTSTHDTVSLVAAAGITSFVAYRYITEHSGSQMLGRVGSSHLNDFLTPIGFTAAGYLAARAMYGDKDEGKTKSALRELPVYGMLAGMAHELAQGAGLVGGVFDPKDLVAYGLGGIAAAVLAMTLFAPKGDEKHHWGAGLLPGLLGGGAIIGAKLAATALLGPAAGPLLGLGLLAAALLLK